tara:strand:- start:141 stop:332 length:192 start_codon:yes stop_codon:yes gene_type:complete
MAFVFTVFTFSSSCSVIVGLQLLNVREKEKAKIMGMSKKSLLKGKSEHNEYQAVTTENKDIEL